MVTGFDAVRWSFILRNAWPYITGLAAYSAVVAGIHMTYDISDIMIGFSIPAVLGVAISIFLGFRTNSAYDRWWEARKVWGGIINENRNFTRQVTHFSTPGANLHWKPLRSEVLQNLIGWNYLLNHSLRGRRIDKIIQGYFTKEEQHRILDAVNPTSRAMMIIGEKVKKFRDQAEVDGFQFMMMEETLSKLTVLQGKCERIKKTIFPVHYSYFSMGFVGLFSSLLPFAVVGDLGWMTIPVSTAVCLVYFMIEGMARRLQAPFEDQMADTPMDHICRNLEREILSEMGEKELPDVIQPVDGLLY